MVPLRQPASSTFLADRVAAIRWIEAPCQGSRRHLVETCRAELEWSCADWRRLGGTIDDDGTGPDAAETWRLPHEKAAQRVVNCHLHVDAEAWQVAKLLPRLRGQRRAALDATQGTAYRLDWANRTAGTQDDLRVHLLQRRPAWRDFLAAVDEYRRLRAAVEPRQALNSGLEIGQIALREVA